MVRSRLRQIAAAKLRWGSRKAYWVLCGEGRRVSYKRVRAYWIDEGLETPRQDPQAPPGRSTDRLAGTHPDHVWALDFQVDVTAECRQIRFCNLVDEFTREALRPGVGLSLDAPSKCAGEGGS